MYVYIRGALKDVGPKAQYSEFETSLEDEMLKQDDPKKLKIRKACLTEDSRITILFHNVQTAKWRVMEVSTIFSEGQFQVFKASDISKDVNRRISK